MTNIFSYQYIPIVVYSYPQLYYQNNYILLLEEIFYQFIRPFVPSIVVPEYLYLSIGRVLFSYQYIRLCVPSIVVPEIVVFCYRESFLFFFFFFFFCFFSHQYICLLVPSPTRIFVFVIGTVFTNTFVYLYPPL